MLSKISAIFKSRLLKDSGIYTLSNIIERAIPFLLLPILTRYLSAEDYGIVSMFSVMMGLTLPFIGVNGNSAILRNYFKKNIDLPVYVFNTFLIFFYSTIIVSIVYIVFSKPISEYSGFPENWLFTIIVVVMSQYLINVLLVIWQAENKAFQYGTFKVLLSLLNVGFAVALVVGFGFDWKGKILGQLTSYILFAILAVFFLKNKSLLKFKISKRYLKHVLKFGLPLIPHLIGSFIITMSDRIFITNMIGIKETGIYTVGYQIGMIVGILAIAFNKAWTPWLFEKLNHNSITLRSKIVKFTYVYFGFSLGFALIITFISPLIIQYLVGEEFYESVAFISWVAFAYSFDGMYLMLVTYIYYTEKTYLLIIITILAATINIALNYYFIENFGSIGAAQATTITYIFKFLITFYVVNKTYDMPWVSGILKLK